MLYLQNTQYMIKIQSNQIQNSNNFSANSQSTSVTCHFVHLDNMGVGGGWKVNTN